jgi:hypothetical protein
MVILEERTRLGGDRVDYRVFLSIVTLDELPEILG